MDRLRAALVSRLDVLLSQLYENPSSHSGAHLSFEVCIFNDQRKPGSKQVPQRLVLDTVRLDDYRETLQGSISGRDVDDSTAIDPTGLPTPTRSVSSPVTSTVAEVYQHNEQTNTYSTRSTARRQEVGGLRLGNAGPSLTSDTPPRTPSPPTARQLEPDDRQFPKRRKLDRDGPAKLEQSTVDKLIEGIWEQIHRPRGLALGRELGEMFNTVNKRLTDGIAGTPKRIDFEDASRCCQQITSGSRTNRALEVIVQAHWVDCYNARSVALQEDRLDLKTYEVKKVVMTEACKLFQWSEKELRNRMAIWKGYKEIKDAAGWGALVFAGPGIYRFCKYRMGFDQDALSKLQQLKTRFEVAADTLQPKWRELLSLVGAPTQLHWRGHPHDWVVSKRKDPVPLSFTYRQLDPGFSFKHVEDSVVDQDRFGDQDPRRVSNGPDYICQTCSSKQSMNADENECECFPDLFGPNPRTPAPVQVFRTDNGKLNGLLACCAFDRGQAVGEFVGLVTKGLDGVDVMQGQVAQNEPYQIWQGRVGNYTRFINHSCQPNCQFQSFTWLGIQRTLVVAKGLPAGKELTVDYSGRYWQGLDKECLCAEARCRYKSRSH